MDEHVVSMQRKLAAFRKVMLLIDINKVGKEQLMDPELSLDRPEINGIILPH